MDPGPYGPGNRRCHLRDIYSIKNVCVFPGYPDPEVVWYKDEQPIKETRHFQIDYDEEGNCSLVISEVNGDDDAKYTVKAVNSLGEATCTAELLVEVMAEEEEEEEE